MPILIGAAMIAAAILLSTLINALGSRYVGLRKPDRGERVAGRSPHRHRLQMPGPGARQGLLRGRDRDRQRRRAAEAVRRVAGRPYSGIAESGLLTAANPTTLPRDAPRDRTPFP